MGRKALWAEIAATLSADIAAGHYGPGARLPTESDLAARFGVNRHTVRRALDHLRESGLVHTRRGAGAFVAQVPTLYPLGPRMRFEQNLRASGRVPARQVLLNVTRSADPREANALGLDTGAPVHAFESLGLSDGQPVSLACSVFPAAALPDLPANLAATASITQSLAACGIHDYTRTWTRVTADLATATQAAQLHLNDPAPVLRTTSLNSDQSGRPLEFGRTWFAAERVTLTLGENPQD